MSDKTEIPYEAFFDADGQPTNATTWTPPEPEPEPDIYDQHIETVRRLKEVLHPTPPETPDEYAHYFPEGA